MADLGKNSFKPWSSKKSLSPPVLVRRQNSHCIWDVEYPKRLLKRSFSERGKPSRVFQQQQQKQKPVPDSSRSVWSSENKEYLEMRFGLLLHHKEMKESCEQQKSPSMSSDSSSVFTNPDCSSFSSGSDDSYISCKDDPATTSTCSTTPAAPVPAQHSNKAPSSEEGEDEEVFLDYQLDRGHLVDNPRAVTRTSDHPAKRHNVDCSRLESPRRKLCSPSPPKTSPLIRPSFEYPVWSSSSTHLTRSMTGLKLEEDHHPHVQDLQQQRFHFSPGRLFGPRSPKLQEQQQQQQPDVHCKSFFLKRPTSFIRSRRRGKESSPMRPSSSDGYFTAQLHCAVRLDHQSFTFIVDGSEELLVARTRSSAAHEEEEEVVVEEQEFCSFFSCKQRRLRSSRSQSWKPAWSFSASSSSSTFQATTVEPSEMVACMRRSRRVNHEEFVLTVVDQRPDHATDEDPRLSFSSWEAKKSPASAANSNSKRSWWSLVPGSPVLRRKSSKSLSTSPSRSRMEEDEDVLREIWKQMEADESVRRARAASRLQELAAFVVSSEPVSVHRQHRPHHLRNNTLECLPENRVHLGSTPVNVTVVLPTGDHGMPVKGVTGGPSPLLKRWRTGSCDCGGWDLGCALHVFQNDPAEAQSKLLEISLQRPGRQQKRDEDVFSLVGLSNGLFSVRFKEPLSSLQAFASAVSILYRSSGGGGGPRNVESGQQWSKVLGLPAPVHHYPSVMHLERL